MRLFFSICFNAIILFAIVYFLPFDASRQTGVEIDMAQGLQNWKLYFVGGVILGMLNIFVRPILSFFSFPLYILTFWFFSVVINGVILHLLERIIAWIGVTGIVFRIHGWTSFIIAVAIFTFFNTIWHAFQSGKKALIGS